MCNSKKTTRKKKQNMYTQITLTINLLYVGRTNLMPNVWIIFYQKIHKFDFETACINIKHLYALNTVYFKTQPSYSLRKTTFK